MTTWVEDDNTYQRKEDSKGNLNDYESETSGYYVNANYTFGEGTLQGIPSNPTGELYRKFIPDRFYEPQNLHKNGYQDMSGTDGMSWNLFVLHTSAYMTAGVTNPNIAGNDYTGYYATTKTIQIKSGSITLYQGYTPPYEPQGDEGRTQPGEVSWFKWIVPHDQPKNTQQLLEDAPGVELDPSKWYYFKPDGSGYVEYTTSPPSESNYALEQYVKRIFDISGKNNHLYIGPVKNVYPLMNNVSDAALYPEQEYYGTNRSYTFYESGQKLDTSVGYTELHPDYNLPAKITGQHTNTSFFTNQDVTFKDGTTGKIKDKYWKSNRWTQQQLDAWNSTPMNKLPVNIKSFVGDEHSHSYSSLENTIQHYPGSASIVSQFSDAQLYDWNSSDTNNATKLIKKDGESTFKHTIFGTRFVGGLNDGYYKQQVVLMNFEWQTNSNGGQNYYDKLGNSNGDSWISSQNNFKVTWNDVVYLESDNYFWYGMFGTPTWSIKYNYGTSTTQKTAFSAFNTTLNAFLDETGNAINADFDLGSGTETLTIYRATESIIEDGIPFIEKAYYIISGNNNKIAKVEATGRKFTRFTIGSGTPAGGNSRNIINYGYHDVPGYYPDEYDSRFTIDTAVNTDTNTTKLIDELYANTDHTGGYSAVNVRLFKSSYTGNLKGRGYSIDGIPMEEYQLKLQNGKLYTFDVSAVKNNNKFAISQSNTSFVDPVVSGSVMSDIWSNSDTLTIQKNSDSNKTYTILNLGDSTQNNQTLKVQSQGQPGLREIEFKTYSGGMDSDFELKSHKITIDFTQHNHNGKNPDNTWGPGNTPGSIPLSMRYIIPAKVTNRLTDNRNATGGDIYNNLAYYLKTDTARRDGGIGSAVGLGWNKPWSFIIGVTKKVNSDLAEWDDNTNDATTLKNIIYKRQEEILANKENDITNHDPPRVLGDISFADISTKNTTELKKLLNRDDYAVARANLVYKISEGIEYKIDGVTYGENDDGASIIANGGKTFSDYLLSKAATTQANQNGLDSDGSIMQLDIDTIKLRNTISPGSTESIPVYFFIWFQEGGANLDRKFSDANNVTNGVLQNPTNLINGYLQYEPIYPDNNRGRDHDTRFGKFLLNKPVDITLLPPGNRDANTVKGILFNKFAARFAHPVGQYGFGDNIIEKGEGIRTFYMVCEIFPSYFSDINIDDQKIPLFDTACPDQYPVELIYSELIQKFHINFDTSGNTFSSLSNYYTKNPGSFSKSLQNILMHAYLVILGYLKEDNGTWEYGFYQQDGTWTQYNKNEYIALTERNTAGPNLDANHPFTSELTPDTTNNVSGSTFCITQRFNINYHGPFLSNPERALTEAKKCDVGALNVAIQKLLHSTAGLGDFKDTNNVWQGLSIIQIDKPALIVDPDDSGYAGIESGSVMNTISQWNITTRNWLNRNNSLILRFTLHKANRLAKFIISKARNNYNNINYWKIDNTSMVDSESSFGKDLLIHLNKDYSGDSKTQQQNDYNLDYPGVMAMLPFIDQDMEYREEIDRSDPNNPYAIDAPSPNVNATIKPDYLTMEEFRRSVRLDQEEKVDYKNPLVPTPAGSSLPYELNEHSYSSDSKSFYWAGNEVVYELFKQIVNLRSENSQTKNNFIKEVAQTSTNYLYSYTYESYAYANQSRKNSLSGRLLGNIYPKTVDGRKSIWSRGSSYLNSDTWDIYRQAIYLKKHGTSIRGGETNDSLKGCTIWINGKKYQYGDSGNLHNQDISSANLNTTSGGKILLVYKDTSATAGSYKFPPANGINILGFANGLLYDDSCSYGNNIPKINHHSTYQTSAGLGLNYLAMYDTEHTTSEIEANIKYLNKHWQVYNVANEGDWEYNQNGSIPTTGNEPTLPGELLFKYKADAKTISGASNIVSSIAGFDLTQSNNTNGFDTSVTSYKLSVPFTVKTFLKEHLTVTLTDPSQPDFEISGDTSLIEGEEKTINVKTFSESRMNITTYSIGVTRQTDIQFAKNKTYLAFSNDSTSADTDITSVSNDAVKDSKGRLELNNTQRLKLKNVFVLGGGSELQKHRKMHAALTLFLVNAKNNNANFKKDKGLKLSRDTFDDSFTSKLKSSITDIVVYPVDAKPDFTDSSTEGAFIPFSDGETFTFTVDSLDVSIKCITSTEQHATGNYTITVPTRDNISKVGGGSINWGTGEEELIIKNVIYNDSFNIYGKVITIGSVTLGGNSGSVRIAEFDNFNDIATHQNEIVKVGNTIYELTLNPNHANNFIIDHTFYNGSNATSYNTQSNIDYSITNAVEAFSSDIQTEEFNINSTGNSSITLKNNVINTSNSTFETIDNSINSTYKATRDITINQDNFETYDSLEHNNKSNLSVDLHTSFDKYNNANETTSYNKLDVHSHINKTVTIDGDISKNFSNNYILHNKKDVNNTFNNQTNIIHQDYNATIENNRNTFINNNLTETLYLNSNIDEIQNSNIDIHTTVDKYAYNINSSHYKSKDVSTLLNETLEIHQQNTQHIYDVDTFTCNSNINITYNKVLSTVTNSPYTKVSESSLNTVIDKNDSITFKHDSNVNHKAKHTNTIYGTSSQFGHSNYTNNNKKDLVIVTNNNISTKHGTNTQFIKGESTESCLDNTIIVKGDNNQIIDGSFDLKTTNNIFFNSVGGLNISTNINNNSLDLNSNVCIKEHVIVSNIPYILNTTALSSYITSDGSETNMLTIDPIYSLVLIALDTNNTLAQTHMDTDLYCRVKLGPGKYNGQHIKLVLHPSFQTFFNNVNDTNYNTIDKRIANNLRTDIIVRIESFADVDANEFVTADLILNRGGMCLNLIYVATNTNTNSISTNNVDAYRIDGVSTTGSGYWMLIGNSFTS